MEIINGVINSAQKLVLYGPEGIGKTTFASQAPDPLFIDVEDGSKKLNVKRTKKPTSWTMLMAQIEEVKNADICKTLIIDTADWAEKLCKEHICAVGNVKSIEDFGYGKGYTKLAEEWGKFLNKLTEVVDNGIHVILLAHAHMRKFEEPNELGAYDRWELKLEKKTAPMLKEWTDTLLFANYKIIVINVDNQGAAKGKNKAQGGQRVMYASHHACWDAKNRDGLNDELDLSYAAVSHIFSYTKDNVVQDKPDVIADYDPRSSSAQVEFSDQALNQALNSEVQNESSNSEDLQDIPKALADLMKKDNITRDEIKEVVALKGYFPVDTPISKYPIDFVNGVLIGAWEQVKQAIISEVIPF